MVFFKFKDRSLNLPPMTRKFVEFMKIQGVIMNEPFDLYEPNNVYRIVVHHYIREKEVETIIRAMELYL